MVNGKRKTDYLFRAVTQKNMLMVNKTCLEYTGWRKRSGKYCYCLMSVIAEI